MPRPPACGILDRGWQVWLERTLHGCTRCTRFLRSAAGKRGCAWRALIRAAGAAVPSAVAVEEAQEDMQE